MKPFQNANRSDFSELVDPRTGSVALIIGENGSGKSFLLGKLARYFSKAGKRKVIAVANTSFDRFGRSSRTLSVCRAAKGTWSAARVVKASIAQARKSQRPLESLFSTC